MRYFRNKCQFGNVDPESLWKLDEENQVMVLVDDDQYVSAEISDEFYEVEEPEELNGK